jgi:hypothetical protein
MYLTDEIFLYRVVDLLLTEAGDVADLEDCYGLDVVRVPLRTLQARGLRVVTPERSGPEIGQPDRLALRRAQESGDIAGELNVMLEQEAVRRV